MTIAVIILAHEHLHRTRALAKAIASKRVKVMIHVDANSSDEDARALQDSLTKNAHIDFCDRVPCEWGRFSLVQAGMNAAEKVLERWPNVSHVIQISGSCLPVRPINELSDFLDQNSGRDFVESFPAEDGDWVVDGLGHERFTLHFPFSWKRQRLLFDAWVNVQRRLGIKRKLPHGIDPHLGSQWWCLSKPTLKAILGDEKRAEYDRYFRKCWIPDEGYIPTLVQRHAKDLVCRSLTLSRFDDQGKPHLFYDDHADLLEQTDHFFARKIWQGADGLYRRFLKKSRGPARPVESDLGLELLFTKARERRCQGRPGRLTVGRFPAAAHELQPSTMGAYGAFIGLAHIFEDFETWLGQTTGTMAHGRLFKKNVVQFENQRKEMPGGLTANPRIRDHNPEQFLCNLLWASADRHHSMMIEYSDSTRMCEFLVNDPNTQLFVLKGAWILELFARGRQDDLVLKRQAARLVLAEQHLLDEIARIGRTDISWLTFGELIQNTQSQLTRIQTTLRPEVDLRPDMGVEMRDFSELAAFVRRLEIIGIDTSTLGPIEVPTDGAAPLRPAIDEVAIG